MPTPDHLSYLQLFPFLRNDVAQFLVDIPHGFVRVTGGKNLSVRRHQVAVFIEGLGSLNVGFRLSRIIALGRRIEKAFVRRRVGGRRLPPGTGSFESVVDETLAHGKGACPQIGAILGGRTRRKPRGKAESPGFANHDFPVGQTKGKEGKLSL